MPITNIEVPLLTNAAAILVLMILEMVLSYLAYRSTAVRTALYGKPSTFYRNGSFNQQEMMRQRFNVADIMEELRNNGTCSLNDVEFIVMETNGKVSVVLKQDKSPATAEMLNLKPKPVRMSYIIIDNGTPIRGCMNRLETGDENQVSPLQCTYERMLIATCDAVANRMMEQKPEAFLKKFA